MAGDGGWVAWLVMNELPQSHLPFFPKLGCRTEHLQDDLRVVVDASWGINDYAGIILEMLGSVTWFGGKNMMITVAVHLWRSGG